MYKLKRGYRGYTNELTDSEYLNLDRLLRNKYEKVYNDDLPEKSNEDKVFDSISPSLLDFPIINNSSSDDSISFDMGSSSDSGSDFCGFGGGDFGGGGSSSDF